MLRADYATRRAWFALACAASIGYEIYALFIRSGGPVLDVRGRRPIVLRDLGAGEQISQTFVARAESLDALTVWVRSDGPVSANVRCALLLAEHGSFVPLYRWVERLDVDGRAARTFTFPPVVPSRNRQFRFDLQLTPPAVRSLGVEAWAEDALADGVMLIGGREQWGDLALRTRASPPFRSLLRNAKGVPDPLRHPAVALLFLAVANWAVVTFVYYMVAADERQW